MNFRVLASLLLVLTTHAQASPAAPSNLRVKPLGINSFLMEWQDNSKNETGWEIRISLGDVPFPERYLLVPTANLTSYVVITNDLPNRTLSFQLAAYNGPTGAEKFSKPTSVVTVKSLDQSVFAAPTLLKATPLDDGRFRLAWTDNSTSEHGYQVQYRKASGPWKELGRFNPDLAFSVDWSGFEPATRYSFRTRAYRGNPESFTPFSNLASASTKAFLSPATLVAKPAGEDSVVLTWKDRSSVEEGFEIQWRTGTDDYQILGTIGANTVSTSPIGGFSANTAYQFRMRGFRTVNKRRVFSPFSNAPITRTRTLLAPTELTGKALGENSLMLSWKDRSKLENGYEIQTRESGKTFFRKLATVAANATEYTATGLAAGTTHEFRVRALSTTSLSAFTPVLRLTTRDGLSGDPDPPIFWNTSFFYRVGVSRPTELASMTVTGLPPGLSYNSGTRTISGTTTFEGVRSVFLRAKFKSGAQVSRKLVLRVIRPPAAPIAAAAFAPATVAVGSTTDVSATGKFDDPDTRAARRVSTSLGDFDIILYPLAAPGTVKNFLAYANAGRYNNTFFHRAAADFVVQGGGYSHDSGSGFKKVPTFAAILNEPGISNLAGTVAMAKLGGNPDSATSEFFVNLRNSNASNLDFQNGGFTVFGRVAGTGMSIPNQINSLPRRTYTLTVDGTARSLEDVPVNAPSAPDPLDPNLLVKVNSVNPVAPLRFEVLSANPAIATATVSGQTIRITGVAPGSTSVQVKAIDLDGQNVNQSIPVSVTGAP